MLQVLLRKCWKNIQEKYKHLRIYSLLRFLQLIFVIHLPKNLIK
jgi:hypothetical protein